MNPDSPHNNLPNLPAGANVDAPVILKAALKAGRTLAELKGYCQKLPNPALLLQTIVLQESKESNAIENIVTTQDELYEASITPLDKLSAAQKEVISYRQAVYLGWERIQERPFITGNLAIELMQQFKFSGQGYRVQPGTKLKNALNGTIVYSPPDPQYIPGLIQQWEDYINLEEEADPLVVMAMMHYQFEAIHPFSDGNGRTGRILNILFLMAKGLLTLPILYHSRYIIDHRNEYYTNLRGVTERGDWESWILYMIRAVGETAETTLRLTQNIIALKEEVTENLKGLSLRTPASDLAELIFSYPYIKIKILEEALSIRRQTASTYLQQMAAAGFLHTRKIGRETYYINHRLMKLLSQ